jgi:hypothetical protein
MRSSTAHRRLTPQTKKPSYQVRGLLNIETSFLEGANKGSTFTVELPTI